MSKINDVLLSLQQEIHPQIVTKVPHDLDFKMHVLSEYLHGGVSISVLSKKYQISRALIYKWIHIFASGKLKSPSVDTISDVKHNSFPMAQKKSDPEENPEQELARLREENKKLQEALKMAEWSNHAKDVMIDLAEKTFNIPIRKKSGAKQ